MRVDPILFKHPRYSADDARVSMLGRSLAKVCSINALIANALSDIYVNSGILWRIDSNLCASVMLRNITVPNGIGCKFYGSESAHLSILVLKPSIILMTHPM